MVNDCVYFHCPGSASDSVWAVIRTRSAAMDLFNKKKVIQQSIFCVSGDCFGLNGLQLCLWGHFSQLDSINSINPISSSSMQLFCVKKLWKMCSTLPIQHQIAEKKLGTGDKTEGNKQQSSFKVRFSSESVNVRPKQSQDQREHVT